MVQKSGAYVSIGVILSQRRNRIAVMKMPRLRRSSRAGNPLRPKTRGLIEAGNPGSRSRGLGRRKFDFGFVVRDLTRCASAPYYYLLPRGCLRGQ